MCSRNHDLINVNISLQIFIADDEIWITPLYWTESFFFFYNSCFYYNND